ncbi:MAG TPA: hypothetical protein DDW34_04375 [Clostridium sp.]|nr:hypothetical protein [Clostridium sp.]
MRNCRYAVKSQKKYKDMVIFLQQFYKQIFINFIAKINIYLILVLHFLIYYKKTNPFLAKKTIQKRELLFSIVPIKTTTHSLPLYRFFPQEASFQV